MLRIRALGLGAGLACGSPVTGASRIPVVSSVVSNGTSVRKHDMIPPVVLEVSCRISSKLLVTLDKHSDKLQSEENLFDIYRAFSSKRGRYMDLITRREWFPAAQFFEIPKDNQMIIRKISSRNKCASINLSGYKIITKYLLVPI